MKNFYCVFVIFLGNILTSVNSDCVLVVKNNSPIFLKNLGLRKVILKNQLQNTRITLVENETILATCSSDITFRTNHGDYVGNWRNLELQCISDDRWMWIKNFDEKILSGDYADINCVENDRTYIYQSLKKFSNCEQPMSYGIGIPMQKAKDIITAAICYDIETATLKYINFLLKPTNNKFLYKEEEDVGLETVSLNIKLVDFQSYLNLMSSISFYAAWSKMKTENLLLNSSDDFEYMNIIQIEKLQTDMQEFDNMFNVMWWSGLRLGNWKLFIDALNERIKTTTYNVFQGTAGDITMPHMDCKSNETLTVEANGVSVNAPEYIWMYLKTWNTTKTAKNIEELVVIGYNSPFLENDKSAIFCEDICNEFKWLNTSQLNRVRLMPARGIVFCCRPADVAQRFANVPFVQEQHKPTPAPATLFDFATLRMQQEP